MDLRESKRRTLLALEMNAPRFSVYDPLNLAPADQARLLEEGLLPASFARLTESALAADEGETMSVAVNTGEHVLIQARSRTEDLESLAKRARGMEAALSLPEHPYAWDSRFGFLSFNPVLAGSGLYVSLILHLPMLSFLRQIRSLEEPLQRRFRCRLTPLGPQDGRASGSLFALGNSRSFERSDEEILSDVREAAAFISGKEDALREKAFSQARVTPMADQAWRAYGTLRYARRLTTEDYLSLWSKMRLGAAAGILPVPLSLVHQMLDFRGDSRYMSDGAERKACPFRRADEVRQALSGGEHANIRKV